jgi:hypothetical protein
MMGWLLLPTGGEGTKWFEIWEGKPWKMVRKLMNWGTNKKWREKSIFKLNQSDKFTSQF